MADNETKPEPPIIFECGPKLTCADGSEHDYSKWEQDGQCGTAVCSKCGHRAIDDAYWM